jgi:hypothetical protein
VQLIEKIKMKKDFEILGIAKVQMLQRLEKPRESIRISS